VGFWIPQEKFSRIPNSKEKNHAGREKSGFLYVGEIYFTATAFKEMINTSVLNKDEP